VEAELPDGAIIDTHAHLDGAEFADDLAAVLQRAAAANVRWIVAAGQDEATSNATLALAQRFPAVAAAVGVHPHLSGDATLGWLEPLLADERIVAVGEMGLDYHYNFSPPERQRDVFAQQLDLAGEHRLPAIIHCREAYDDLAVLLGRHYKKNAPAVIHCFTESYEIGRRFIDEFGVFLGIGGVATFKNSHLLHDAVRRLPLTQLVLETDCPFLTPAPHRGKRNEPAFVRFTCQALAALRGIALQEAAAVTSENAMRLFPKLARRNPVV